MHEEQPAPPPPLRDCMLRVQRVDRRAPYLPEGRDAVECAEAHLPRCDKGPRPADFGAGRGLGVGTLSR